MNKIVNIMTKIWSYGSTGSDEYKNLDTENIRFCIYNNIGHVTCTVLLKDKKQNPLCVYRYDNRYDEVLFQDYENGLFEDIVIKNLEIILKSLEIKRNSEQLKKKLEKNNLTLYYINKYFKI